MPFVSAIKSKEFVTIVNMCLITYPAPIYERCQHDDGRDLLLHNHPPEVTDSIGLRALRCNKRISLVVTLKGFSCKHCVSRT